MSEKAKIKTPCKSCCFAEWKGGPNSLQTGCAMGRLPIYIKQDKAEKQDNYYEIQTFCTTCRNNEWAEEKGGDLVELQRQVRKECQIQMDYIVFGDENDGLEDFVKTAEKIAKQKIQPKSVIFCVNNVSLVRSLKEKAGDFLDLSKVKVYTHHVLGVTNPEVAVNDAIKKCRHHYITIVKNGERFPDNLNEKFNYLINEELKQISMICDSEYSLHGIVVQRTLYNNLGGTISKDVRGVIYNIKMVAEDQNQERMLTEWKQIFPE